MNKDIEDAMLATIKRREKDEITIEIMIELQHFIDELTKRYIQNTDRELAISAGTAMVGQMLIHAHRMAYAMCGRDSAKARRILLNGVDDLPDIENSQG